MNSSRMTADDQCLLKASEQTQNVSSSKKKSKNGLQLIFQIKQLIRSEKSLLGLKRFIMRDTETQTREQGSKKPSFCSSGD